MEGKVNCPNCGNLVERDAVYCGFCAKQLRNLSPDQGTTGPIPVKKKGVMLAIVSIVVALIVIIAVAVAWNYNPSSSGNGTDGNGPGGNNGEKDSDGDGYPDSIDEFPHDPNEWRDKDGDGVGDNRDDFPNDSTEWKDSDNDGHGDNSDEYPHDSSEWRDSDSDGIGDNADFYDYGNGGIKVKVSYIAVTSDCDFWSACDPYFEFRIDANNDGSYEFNKKSPTTQDRNVISNPSGAYYIVDIPDGKSRISFCIIAFDDDVTADETIDYTPGGDFAYCHTVYSPYSDSWSYSGSSPSGPHYARLDYSISVVSMG